MLSARSVCLHRSVFLFRCSYVEKFTEFMRLFVSIHLHRFESNSQFPVLEFLALLFKYTFKQVRARTLVHTHTYTHNTHTHTHTHTHTPSNRSVQFLSGEIGITGRANGDNVCSVLQNI